MSRRGYERERLNLEGLVVNIERGPDSTLFVWFRLPLKMSSYPPQKPIALQ
jgi:hypothetical protein